MHGEFYARKLLKDVIIDMLITSVGQIKKNPVPEGNRAAHGRALYPLSY